MNGKRYYLVDETLTDGEYVYMFMLTGGRVAGNTWHSVLYLNDGPKNEQGEVIGESLDGLVKDINGDFILQDRHSTPPFVVKTKDEAIPFLMERYYKRKRYLNSDSGKRDQYRLEEINNHIKSFENRIQEGWAEKKEIENRLKEGETSLQVRFKLGERK
jgi:hypothetical protein